MKPIAFGTRALLILLLVVLAVPALAQRQARQADNGERVVTAYPLDPTPPGRMDIGLADMLVVQVADLAAIVGADNTSCPGLRLVMNGVAFDSPLPHRCDLKGNRVLFNLDLLDRTGKAWTDLLAARKRHLAAVDVSLYLEGKGTLRTDARGLTIILMNQIYGLWALAGYVLVVIFFLILARRTQMLRDSGPKSKTLRPYSLARVQTAWWTLLVLGAFLLISLMTGTTVSIPGSILGLMGIAAGTFLGAELVDSNPKSNAEGAADAEAAPAAPAASEGFVRDILSDGSGVAFHRFQMVIWAVALGILFMVKVGDNLAMPEFDTTLLGLMGISNGTYLGMKMGENGK